MEEFVSHYGLGALFLLATVEGDASLVLAGVLVHAGLLPLAGAMGAGAAGNLLGDCAWFLAGRRLRGHIRESRLYRLVGHRIEWLAGRLGPSQLLAARVVYGTRNASMLFWGQFGLPFPRFLAVDTLGCALAAVGYVLAGRLLGHGATALAGDLRRAEHWLLAVAGCVALVAGVSRVARRRLERPGPPSPEDGP